MQTHIITSSSSLRHGWLVRGAAALLAIAAVAAIPGRAQAGIFVSVNIAPPPLPVYVQPAIPGPGYIWTPGYWAWSDGGYYWVPGTWVLSPFIGALWTPGYWGWGGGVYLFHPGYWGWHVGFYGGINYGFGYTGYGYAGGYWGGNNFYYNRTVNHVTNNITNVYNRTVINNTTIVNRTSFNGGPHGVVAQATPQQLAWANERHSGPVGAQLQQSAMASHVQSLRASVNHGAPPIAATPRAGAFNNPGIVAAHGAPTAMAASATRYTPPASRAPQAGFAPQRDGALRSAGFAPHANATMQPNGGNRYNPAPASHNNARPDAYAAPRSQAPNRYQAADDGYRGNSYRPQAQPQQAYRPAQHYEQQAYRQAPHYEQPAYRPAPHYEQMPYRPANPRPAQYAHAPAPRSRPVPAAHEERGDSKHH